MGWKEVRLGDILTESKIESTSPSVDSRIRVLLNAKGVIKRPAKKETKGATKYFIRAKGQFIYGKQNIHKGAFGIVPDDLDGFESTSDLPAFDVDNGCLPIWIDYYLKQGNFYLDLVNIARGAATQRVQPKELLELKIPLPPLSEQRKIVAHFKSIETEDTELKTELTHQQTLLKKLRQQILQEAIEGKLTKDWRAENPNIEPASELLKRIQAEKTQLIKNKKIKKQKPLPPISDEEKPFELPDGWVWLKVDYFLEYKKRGMITGPFGTALQKSEHQSKGIPVYGIETIKNGKFTYRNKIFVTSEKANELRSFNAETGDIIISRSGTIDEICTIPKNVEPGLISTNLLRVSLLPELIESKYFCYLFKGSVSVLEKLKELCSGSTRLFLNQKILKTLVFPTPPLPEQKAIVAKVEKLLALCDQLETQITSNQSHAEQLMQAVLKEAFTSEATEQVAANA